MPAAGSPLREAVPLKMAGRMSLFSVTWGFSLSSVLFQRDLSLTLSLAEIFPRPGSQDLGAWQPGPPLFGCGSLSAGPVGGLLCTPLQTSPR